MLATLLILLGTYYVLIQVGVAGSGAAFWAPTAAALVAVLLLWRAAQSSSGLPLSDSVRRSKLARRVLALATLTYLSSSLVGGLVAAFVPIVPPGGSPDHAIALNLRLATTVGLPITLILLFGVGRLSAKWLAVRKPFRWLSMISLIPALASLALHPVALALSRNFGSTPPRDLAEIAPRMVAVTVLIFCALAFGNLSGRKSLRRPASTENPGDGTGPDGVDSGEVTAPNRTTH